MAGRRSKGVRVLTNRDISMLKGLARTGVSTREMAYRTCGVNSKRLEKLEYSGYIRTEMLAIKGGGTALTIRLNDKGKDYLKYQHNMRYMYKSDNRQITHDLRLSEVYFGLSPKIRETWKTETEVTMEVKLKHDLKSLKVGVDAVITTPQGMQMAIEVIGDSYTEEQILEKYEFAETYYDGMLRI